MSLSTVIAWNERSHAASSSGCRSAAGSAASVNRNASMVAMSGWIMPEPLAMPATVTSVAPMRARAQAPLAKVSVVQIASAAARQVADPSCIVQAGQRGRDLVDRKRLADHAGRCDEHVLGPRIEQGGHRLRLGAHRGVARRADHHVGVAGIDHERRAPDRAAAARGTMPPDGRARASGSAGRRPWCRGRARPAAGPAARDSAGRPRPRRGAPRRPRASRETARARAASAAAAWCWRRLRTGPRLFGLRLALGCALLRLGRRRRRSGRPRPRLAQVRARSASASRRD